MVIAIDNSVKPDNFGRTTCVLKALYMLKRAFFLLTQSTIYNCSKTVLRQGQRGIEEIDSGEQCSGVMTDHEICAERSGQVLLADDGEDEPEIKVDAEEANSHTTGCAENATFPTALVLNFRGQRPSSGKN